MPRCHNFIIKTPWSLQFYVWSVNWWIVRSLSQDFIPFSVVFPFKLKRFGLRRGPGENISESVPGTSRTPLYSPGWQSSKLTPPAVPGQGCALCGLTSNVPCFSAPHTLQAAFPRSLPGSRAGLRAGCRAGGAPRAGPCPRPPRRSLQGRAAHTSAPSLRGSAAGPALEMLLKVIKTFRKKV